MKNFAEKFVADRLAQSICYAIPGLFTSDQGIVGTRTGDFASAILQTYPDGNAPLLGLTSGMQSESAKDTMFNWFEEARTLGRYKLTNSPSTGGTSFIVTDGSSIIAGTVLKHEASGEVVYVTGVSGNTLTVIRGMADTTAAAAAADDYLTRIGTAFEEGMTGMPTAVVNQGSARWNYVQIFRNAWSYSGTLKAISFHTGSQVAKNKADCGAYHAEDMERAFWWGKKHMGTANNKRLSMTDGVDQQIRTYGGIVETTSPVSTKTFRSFLRELFANNIKGKPNERISFCGSVALETLNDAVAMDGSADITTGQTEFGLNFSKLVSPFGSLKLITHPLFNEHPVYSSWLYALHPGAIKTRYLRRTIDESYDRNGARIDGSDADHGVLTTEVGIALMCGMVHGIYEGIDEAEHSYTLAPEAA